MLTIRLLGGFELVLSNGSRPDRLGPKSQGLLAVLAMSRGQPVSRSRLAGLLWGERDEDLARHSLSQALTTVRAALGPSASDVLLADSEGLRLATDSVALDVDDFERAVHTGRREPLEEACRLYRGEFLEGLEIREAGFEEWLLSARYRLGELAADAFARLLDLQIAAGGAEAAIETARRLVALTPLDETTHARLIRLYGELGRRGLAEAHYARCAELVQRELGQAPDDELVAALADARRRSPGRPAAAAPAPTRPEEETVGHPERRRHGSPWRTRWIGSAAAAVLAMLVGTLAWTFNGTGIGGIAEQGPYDAAPWDLPAEPSIAVLPFENLSGDPEQAYFADGITHDIITDLSKFSTLFVTAADSSFRYQGGAAKVQDVARDLRVRYVLEGSVQRADETLRISATLVDATTGRHVWAERYERPAENVFAVQKEITQTIVGIVGSGWGELERAELERVRRLPTEDLQAYDFYLLGVAYKNRKTKEDNALARQMFEKAIQADSNYARALAECSLTYLNDVFNTWTGSREDALQKAEELARRAIEIDSSEPWGFVTLGLVYQLKAGNKKALPLFEKAHALNPNDYYVKQALGYAMTWSGSAERAIELLEQSHRLNPYTENPPSLAMAYFFAHRYEDALAMINRVTSREESPTYWLYTAAAHAQLGQLDEARAAVAQALKLDPKLTVEREHERRLAMGLAPANAELLSTALRKAGLPERAPERAASYQDDPWPLPPEPSIAVLPFANLSDVPRLNHFVDGITRDVITDLSRFSSLFVISANSTFRYQGRAVRVREVARDLGVRYVLEGSVQRAGDALWINASLIDATTGRHVWAERYERRTEDVFATQKEISQDVAVVIGSERGLLLQAELERIARKPTTSLAAYELFQRGVYHRNLETREDTATARELLEEAVRLDPTYARAIANVGMTYLDDIWGDWTDSREQSLRRAEELARRATQVDSAEPLGYVVLGLAHFLDSRHDQAIALLEKAKALNPNDDHITHSLGYVLAYSGTSPETGVQLLKDMQRRNPYYPEVILRDLAQAYLFAHRYEDALAALNQVARRHRPSYWLFKAAGHAHLDQMGEARAAVAEALKLNPKLTIEGEHERRLAMGLGPTNAELLSAALRKAGLPEQAAH